MNKPPLHHLQVDEPFPTWFSRYSPGRVELEAWLMTKKLLQDSVRKTT
jgi:hypothetical protein